MKSKTLIDNIHAWLSVKKIKKPTEWTLPTTLMSDEQMEQYGSVLAHSHRLSNKHSTGVLLKRLVISEDILQKAYQFLTQVAYAGNHITPAAEWLLDNFYLIEEQILLIKRHLPKKYEKGLPQLDVGFMKPGYPRAYDIAFQLIQHTDAVWRLDNLTHFVDAYQTVTKLTIGELWAIPIMLRLALIENLSHLSVEVVSNLNDHYLADIWATKLEEIVNTHPKQMDTIVNKMIKADLPMTSAFVAEFTRRLHSAEFALPLQWINQRLAENDLTLEQMIQSENTQQAMNQVTVSNSISSLRRLSEVDWRKFVEHMSIVEEILSQDPTDTYRHMDFTTRDRYRHVVECLARKARRSEAEVATIAINLAIVQHRHVGFYLIDEGRPQLRTELGLRNGYFSKKRDRLLYFLGPIALFVVGATGFLLIKASQSHVNMIELLILALVMCVCISQAALALANWAVMLCVKPKMLPKMDFTKDIPVECRTLIVVPSMIGSVAQVESLISALEVRYLGNKEEHLYFALLTDFNDAKEEHMPEDQALLDLAQSQIIALNERYSRENEDIFFLMHRPRRWNTSENIWMGYERKRGKLSDLNDLLRGDNQSNFLLIVGRTDVLQHIKYVITLDTDTQLPRESARQMIGAMAHPLNQPVYDAQCQRVVSGYGILQPRMAEALANPGPTRYVWICGSDSSVDPYTRAVSNVYQDLFQEGSFIGKGIYDVDMFKQVLGEKLPENRILSHDLLEGCFLRCGFLSDVPLYEVSPGSYLTDVKRRYRWIRGDWQLIDWLTCPFLSALSKWKLFDNLRRSLVPVSLLLLLIIGWAVLPQTDFWFYVILGILLLPWGIATLVDILRKPKDMEFKQHAHSFIPIVHRSVEKLILYLACLPHEAWYSTMAIMRTLWRLNISHRHLLEWTPSDQIDHQFHDTLLEWFASMWMGPVLGLLMSGILISTNKSGSLLLGSPLLILWIISPLLAYLFSRPYVRKQIDLSAIQIRFLHRVARRTWSYFETFITEKDHWLPPDNYQEEPVEVLCHRTSPTNIGLALLANLTAYDFGYIGTHQLLTRVSNTLQTMSMLERYRGHFYNWYDTLTLEPLHPYYVSTVDGGNLAGHLLTLRQGLLALMDAPLLRSTYLDGLEDTLDVLTESISKKHPMFIQFRTLLNKIKITTSTGEQALHAVDTLCDNAQAILTHCEENIWAQKLLRQCESLRDDLKMFDDDIANITLHTNLRGLKGNEALSRIKMIESLAEQTFSFAQMDMSFLYNQTTNLMTIGFNVDKQLSDNSHYDLLSSEARLASFIAIAQGQVPQESWFALGRLQVMSQQGQPVMMSWSGSMFEYLMPLLVMPSYPDTLLDKVCQAAVQRHIDYGKQRGVPWGVSESGYHAMDTHLNYLYRAFGVPELGLKRGLSDDLVIAPYATVMALMVEPKAACLNLERLAAQGALGQYGFYEAIDFTKSRLPRHRKHILVRSFMVHHEAMSLLAFSYLLHDQPMQRRFAADPLIQSTLLLLQERVPKPVTSYFHRSELSTPTAALPHAESSVRVFNTPNTPMPEVQLLSNGRYHVAISQAGAGFSRWKNLAITRWREDGICDNWGLFAYIRDVKNTYFWSTIYQPTADSLKNFKAIFSQGHAEFHRSEEGLEVQTQVVVSPEDDIEIRRSHIYNRSKMTRTIEFTTYAEVVLAPQGDDEAQPAFSNLFVETELLSEYGAILATRRSRTEEALSPWMCQKLNVYTDAHVRLSFETNRELFLGRGRTAASPQAMLRSGDLSNTMGTVLDPIMSIRCRVTIQAGKSLVIDLITGVSETREASIDLIKKYHDHHWVNRTFELAGTYALVMLHQLNITPLDAELYTKMAAAIIYVNNIYRASPSILASNRYGQSKLWQYSISGDLPIVLLSIENVDHVDMVRQLIHAQSYWRRHGLKVDLVILNEEATSYRQMLQDQIMSFASTKTTDHDGDIFVHMSETMPLEDRILLQSVARLVFSDKQGTLKEQLKKRYPSSVTSLLQPEKTPRHSDDVKLAMIKELRFFNGIGGFNLEGNEYIIQLKSDKNTHAPWINILANPHFGTLVSESGRASTWIENAHECRLTPWENDAVKDAAGEAFYIRDDDTGQYWSPTALPCRGRGDYQIRHGFGYSIFEHIEDGIYSELTMYVAFDAPVKFIVLKIRNDSKRFRSLSVMGYVEWVLGDYRAKNAPYVVSEMAESGALIAQNHYNTAFGEKAAFFHASTDNKGLSERTVTASRLEFIGRNRSQERPAALEAARLSGSVGAGLGPCAAIHLAFDLMSSETREIIFTLGAAENKNEALALAMRYQNTDAANVELNKIQDYWRHTLSAVRVKTPDVAVDLLANGWLQYQTIASRLWGRTGFYQSSGAYGFRDQLQDVMSVVHTKPEYMRAQLLLCASRQFVEGDVQHWWHPPLGQGVRTRCSDDYLWLPFVLCYYIETTGDMAVLDVVIPFLQGRPLKDTEESYYETPTISTEKATLYQHAVRAIEHGFRFGKHGLPLMGSGDWNDGMNLVGIKGEGESVWLGFFLYDVLQQFGLLATRCNDTEFAKRCDKERLQLQKNIEKHGWDGEWYRRAYFDDGTPLGSSSNTECRIDSIAQSWSVLSGAGESIRAKQAMVSLHQYLVRPNDQLVALLTPPFQHSKPNPGYIQGYVPGIRENGGQYTHAATWAAIAFAALGENALAWQICNLINPIYHGDTAQVIDIYKIEPYVLAGDVYSVAPHIGCGGWSWYTGSAGWMYRLIVESLLGIQLENGNQLRFTPCLPADWNHVMLDYRFGKTIYQIDITRSGDKPRMMLDGKVLPDNIIPLRDDGQLHQIDFNRKI